MISILTTFGSTAASGAVQTPVNRQVMLARQAKTFGMQELLDNPLVLVTLASLGGLASVIDPRLVFLFAPPLLVAFVVWLIWASLYLTAHEPPEVQAILRSIFNPVPWDSAVRSQPARGDRA